MRPDRPSETTMSLRLDIHPTHPQARLVERAAAVLRDGGLVAYPTDSSYALGCALDAFEAIDRMRAIRGIDERHPLSLVCATLAQAGRYARLDNWQFRIVRAGLPGPYTFLVPATRDVPRRARDPKRNAIGIRVPEHRVAAALLEALGAPVLSTSLILSGETEAIDDPDAIEEAVGRRIDALVEAGPPPGGLTTVVDLTAPPGSIVRRGRGDPARLGLD